MKRTTMIAPSLPGAEAAAPISLARGTRGPRRITLRKKKSLLVASFLSVSVILQPEVAPSAEATTKKISYYSALSSSSVRGLGPLPVGAAGSRASTISGSYAGYEASALVPFDASGYALFGRGSRDLITSAATPAADNQVVVFGSPPVGGAAVAGRFLGEASAFSLSVRPILADDLAVRERTFVGQVLGPGRAKVWFAYAKSGAPPHQKSCPPSSVVPQRCSLAQALSLASPGGIVELATLGVAGVYRGNWRVLTGGTSASHPLTIEAARPGVKTGAERQRWGHNGL
jgi:hypothetical protein